MPQPIRPERRFCGVLVVLVGLAAVLLQGCRYEGYQTEHFVRAYHIFGLGFIRETTATNDTRAFAIGSLEAGHYQLAVNTNAPMKFTGRSTAVRTNISDPNPIGVKPRAP